MQREQKMKRTNEIKHIYLIRLLIVIFLIISFAGCNKFNYHELLLQKYYDEIHLYNVDFYLIDFEEKRELKRIEEPSQLLAELESIVESRLSDPKVKRAQDIEFTETPDMIIFLLPTRGIFVADDLDLFHRYLKLRTRINRYLNLNQLEDFATINYHRLKELGSFISENKEIIDKEVVKEYFDTLPSPSKVILAGYIKGKVVLDLPFISSKKFHSVINNIDKTNYQDLVLKVKLPYNPIENKKYVEAFKNYYDFEELVNSL